MPRRKTHEEFIEEVNLLHKGRYTILSRYEGSRAKIRVIHNECGCEVSVRSDSLLKGSKCLKCTYKGYTKTHEEYVKQVYDVHGSDYVVVSEYKGAHETIDIKHTVCGSINTVNANSVLQGKKCVHCFNKKRTKSHEEFVEEVHNLVGSEYSVVSPYQTAIKPITFRHEECGHEFSSSANAFVSGGNRCPNCSYSKGEQNIKRVLDRLAITYTREKEFEGLMYKRPLRFDFYLPDYNLCIEYDGKQHYEPIPYFGGEEGFKKIQYLDGLKNTYCKDNQIHLLRIPYTSFEDEEGLVKDYIERVLKGG